MKLNLEDGAGSGFMIENSPVHMNILHSQGDGN